MTPEQHGAWQATLDEYIDLGDRSREPVFVGRDEHLEKIERSLRTARSDASSRTVIFQGAPGAGKSALLRELRERYEGAVNTNTPGTRALVNWAVGCSDGWPHHLRMAMTGIAHAMRAQNSPNLRTLDRASIVEYVTERRNDYYGKRIKATKHPAFREAFRALALETAGDTAEVAELVMVAKQALHGADAALEPPAPYALVASAIHAGILQHVSSTHLTCPIPSMRHWLEAGQYTAPAIPEFGHRRSRTRKPDTHEH